MGDKNLKIKLLLFTCFIILTASIGCVCASSDMNATSNDVSLIHVEDTNHMNIQCNANGVANLANSQNSVELPDDDYEGDILYDSTFTGLNGIIKLHEYLTDEIVLDHDYSFTGSASDLKYQNGIEITKDNFVIDGNGHTIDAKNVARLFNINANNVVIKNLNFINANGLKNVDLDNGIIHFFNPGTVVGCTFKNCILRQHGTVYFEKGGNISNSNFIECSCGDYGGALYINGGTIENCTFIKNKLGNCYGAAVYAKGDVLINNSEFTQNFGGLDSAIHYDGHLTLENCNFTDNKCVYSYNSDKDTYNFVGSETQALQPKTSDLYSFSLMISLI